MEINKIYEVLKDEGRLSAKKNLKRFLQFILHSLIKIPERDTTYLAKRLVLLRRQANQVRLTAKTCGSKIEHRST